MTMEPDFTKPVDIHAFFARELGYCECSDMAPIITVIKNLLEWHGKKERDSCEILYHGNIGIYFILAGIFHKAGLSTHGGTIRFPWLTKKGESLLIGLRKFTSDEIESCGDTPAYDGLSYDLS